MKIINDIGIIWAIIRGLFEGACVAMAAFGIGHLFNFPEVVLDAWGWVLIASTASVVGLIGLCALCWYILCLIFA